MSPAASFQPLRENLEDVLRATIPMARMMDLRITAWDGQTLDMSAPLAPNINDKGCAFGGSLASVLTLAGWSLVHLATDEAGIDCDIYVQDSSIRYLLPIWGDFSARARLAEGESFADFVDALRVRGKARLAVTAAIVDGEGNPACTFSSRFVALAKAVPSRPAADAASSLTATLA